MFSRRQLIKRFGLMAGSLPLLDAFGNRAFADGAVPLSKRIVCIVVGHGVFSQHWLPYVAKGMPIATTSPGNMLKAPSDYLREVAFEQRTGCSAIDLAPYTNALSPIHSAKWQPFKKKTAFLNNLSCSNATVQGHTSTAQLGGYKNGCQACAEPASVTFTGETVDVVIGRKLNGRLPLVLKCPDNVDDARFTEEAGSSSVHKKSDGTFEMATALKNTLQVWDTLFADYKPPVTGPKKRDPTARRTALLERTLQNISTIKTDQRLSAYDKQRLDNHASIIEAQRTNLANMTMPKDPVLAVPPPKISGNPGLTVDTFNTAKGALFRGQFANAAAAIKMNKAQAVVIDSGLENEWITEGLDFGGSQAYHGNAGHLANPSDAMIEMIRRVQLFVFDAIADFIAELDTVEDPNTGATYLDNTMVLVVPEHDGRPNGHLRGAVPVIMAGGLGSFTGGKSYDFSVPKLRTPEPSCIYQGISYSRLLYTVLDTYGITTAERASMDIQGVEQSWQGADMTDWNKPLTGLT